MPMINVQPPSKFLYTGTMAKFTRLMAFDFGLKRIGVAHGQTISKTTQALTTLKANNGQPNWKQVSQLIQEWEPQALIVGIPYNMDGSEQFISRKAREFADQLKNKVRLEVFLCDERLTTVAARDYVFSQGGYKALNSKQIDAVAAAIILESWMNQLD